jgi:flagellar hook-associated protein 2
MVLRVSGLASGIDTDTIIKDMMTARRAPVNKLVLKRQILEWQREDYRNMNSKILDFRNSKLFEFKKDSTLSAKSATVSGASDVISVSPTASSVNGTYNIEVSQMATATTRITTPAWGSTAASSATLGAGLAGLTTGRTEFSINVNGKEFTFDKTVDTLDSVISKINNDPSAKVTLFFDSSSRKISVTAKGTGSAGAVAITDGTGGGNLAEQLFNKSYVTSPVFADGYTSSQSIGSGLTDLTGGSGNNYTIKVNGVNFTIDKSATSLDSLISQINTSPGLGVTLNYDSSTQKISVAGSSGAVTITDVTGNLAAKLFNKTGQDALVKINGISTVQSSNTFKVNGADVTIKGLSPETAPGVYTPTTFEVRSDVDKIIESVKGFIADYNEILKTLNDKISENRYRDFTPLTSEQKESMKEKEIELWEAKAKSGQLKNDGILSKLIGEMRTAIVSSVNTGSTKYKTLSSLGIETGSYEENGKLYLKDEAKLREALEKEPEAVKELFTSDDDGAGHKGVTETLYDSMYNSISLIAEKAGTSKYSSAENFKLNSNSLMGKQLSSLDTQISSWNDRLADIEDRYYRQFTAMEQAISKYNSQSAYLTNSLGG